LYVTPKPIDKKFAASSALIELYLTIPLAAKLSFIKYIKPAPIP
jgi:hypothetical protein